MSGEWKNVMSALGSNPSYRKIYELMQGYGDATAAELMDKEGRLIRKTYRECTDEALKACGYFENSKCFNKGDMIGLLYPTTPDWPVLLWGILMAGGIPLLLNPEAKPEHISSILKEAKVRAYVANHALSACEAAYIPASAVFSGNVSGTPDWEDRVALCTSGTTGASRIFIYDGPAITQQIISFDEAKQKTADMPFDEEKDTNLLAFLPFNHIFGFSVIYILYSVSGKKITYLKDKSPSTVLDVCRRGQVTHFYCVPMFFNALADALKKQLAKADPALLSALPAITERSIALQSEAYQNGTSYEFPKEITALRERLLGSSVRCLITGGGRILPESLTLLNGLGYAIHNGFGMTESGIVSVDLSSDPMHLSAGSVGTPFSTIEYRIADPKNGVGELEIRGTIMHSASVIDGQIVPRDKDLWYKTGDLARLDGGNLFIEGRLKDVIVNADGENIYPDILEEAFHALPGVSNYSILGLKNGAYEDVALILEVQETALFDETAVLSYIHSVNETLPPFENVRRIFIANEALPLSGNMKIRRSVLKNAIENGNFSVTELTSAVSKGSDRTEDPLYRNPEFLSILSCMRSTFSEVLEIPEDEITDTSHFVTDLGGDSLDVFDVLSRLEAQYGIAIPDEDAMSITNLFDASRMIYEHLRKA